ncbi:HalOD1 output domain-containing protein [Halovivax limisalsi]|uniref:HalOD1 output domain-containing protein n=1 Tax=Halovivax limisalsi TaxID=1453760 RepID=UPI001FFCB56A|nr:HalOD1 output domain-containing protein [Halovivax limisalsi]
MRDASNAGGAVAENGPSGRTEYRRSTDEPVSVAVATALARFEGTSPTGTGASLYEHVDPDALDALFADRADGTSRRPGTVRFTTASATVVVEPDVVRVFECGRH